MPRRSAGLLCYRRRTGAIEVLLVHPGGPFWAGKDDGAWSIPKGEVEPGEEEAAVAAREFAEELGQPPPPGPWRDLGEVTQAGGKRVRAWAVEGDLDVDTIISNHFTMVWPPRSGRLQSFPEVDRAAWWPPAEAEGRLVAGQRPLLERLLAALDGSGGSAD